MNKITQIVFIHFALFCHILPGAHSLYAEAFPQIEGWQVSSEVLTFTKHNLWEHINGAADQFIDYEFVELQTCEMTQSDMVISIEIYRMNSDLHAFGIYIAERPSETNRLAIGGEAVILPPGQLLLNKGIYYIKIYAYEGEFTEQNGTRLLTAIASALPGSDGLPYQLSLLPKKFKIPGSENFISKSFLGLKDLQNCLFAEYVDSENTRYRLFYILGENQAIWDTLGNRDWKNIEIEQNNYLYRSIPYKGTICIYLEQDYIKGIAFIEDIEDIVKIRSHLKVN